MKKLILAGGAAVALAAVPALAIQQDNARQAQPMTRADVQTRIQTQFAKADADRDGFVTKAEAEARIGAAREQRQAKRGERRAEMFARLDANRDGSLSREEFAAPKVRTGEERAKRRAHRGMRGGKQGGMMMGGFGARFFERADIDKDGRVSLAEASARSLARFDRADANKDGTVTDEERRAARKTFRHQRQTQPNG
jgi:hypothetical protein